VQRDGGAAFSRMYVGPPWVAVDETVRTSPVVLQRTDQGFESLSKSPEAKESDSIAQAVGVEVKPGNIQTSHLVEGGRADKTEGLHIEGKGRGSHVDVAGEGCVVKRTKEVAETCLEVCRCV
jgi:hypothetical protein